MNVFSLAILFLIVRPIIKGISEANKKKRIWEKRQQSVKPQLSPMSPSLEPLYVDTTDKKTIMIDETLESEPADLAANLDDHIAPNVKQQLEDKMHLGQKDTLETKGASFDLLDEDNILRGIILKEVLSPPKFFR